jgi:hypothetical protein
LEAAQTAQSLKRQLGQHNFFFYNSILLKFSLKGTTLFYRPLKFQKRIHVFEALS